MKRPIVLSASSMPKSHMARLSSLLSPRKAIPEGVRAPRQASEASSSVARMSSRILKPRADNPRTFASSTWRRSMKKPLIGSDTGCFRTRLLTRRGEPAHFGAGLVPLSRAAACRISRGQHHVDAVTSIACSMTGESRLVVLQIGVHDGDRRRRARPACLRCKRTRARAARCAAGRARDNRTVRCRERATPCHQANHHRRRSVPNPRSQGSPRLGAATPGRCPLR